MRQLCAVIALLVLCVATPARAAIPGGATVDGHGEAALLRTLPHLGGLLPGGPTRPVEASGGRLPLLGGLGGLPPVNPLSVAGEPGTGLPPGGEPVPAGSLSSGQPIGLPSHRPFSPDVRPIAGIDEQYK